MCTAVVPASSLRKVAPHSEPVAPTAAADVSCPAGEGEALPAYDWNSIVFAYSLSGAQ